MVKNSFVFVGNFWKSAHQSVDSSFQILPSNTSRVFPCREFSSRDSTLRCSVTAEPQTAAWGIFWLLFGDYHKAQKYPKPSFIGLLSQMLGGATWHAWSWPCPCGSCDGNPAVTRKTLTGADCFTCVFTPLSYSLAFFLSKAHEKKEVEGNRPRACVAFHLWIWLLLSFFSVTFFESSSHPFVLPTGWLPPCACMCSGQSRAMSVLELSWPELLLFLAWGASGCYYLWVLQFPSAF